MTIYQEIKEELVKINSKLEVFCDLMKLFMDEMKDIIKKTNEKPVYEIKPKPADIISAYMNR